MRQKTNPSNGSLGREELESIIYPSDFPYIEGREWKLANLASASNDKDKSRLPTFLKHLSTDRDAFIRNLAAEHPKLKDDMRGRLLHDHNQLVRESARDTFSKKKRSIKRRFERKYGNILRQL